jgi:hypothetical protein
MGIIGQANVAKALYKMNVGDQGFAVTASLLIDFKDRWYVDIYACNLDNKYHDFILPVRKLGPGAGEYEFNVTGLETIWIRNEDPTRDEFGEKLYGIVKLGEQRHWNHDKSKLARRKPVVDATSGTNSLERKLLFSRAKKKIIDDNQRHYPLTYLLRQELNLAVLKEHYEDAARLRDEINKSKEPLITPVIIGGPYLNQKSLRGQN